MGERPVKRRRVLIEDGRRDGRVLRASWHPERRQFVLSTWQGDVCTGAARVDVADGAELVGLLADGLAEAAAAPPPEVAPPPPARPGLAGLAGLADRLRAWVRGAPPAGPRARPAPPAAARAARRSA
jgi:hypothetical protein